MLQGMGLVELENSRFSLLVSSLFFPILKAGCDYKSK